MGISVNIKCQQCDKPIEIDSEWAGQKIECPHCHARFNVQLSQGITPTKEQKSKIADIDKRPKMLWVGLIWLYFIVGMCVFGCISENTLSYGTIGWACLMTYGVFKTQRGNNKARITLTVLLGIVSIFLLRHFGFFIAALLGSPIAFFWLPQCNRWFKRQKELKDGYRIK